MERAAKTTVKSFDAESLIRQHQVGVWRYLRALGCPNALAEDLTQDTFLRVLQRPFDVYDDAATAGYLRKVAFTLFVSHHRRETRKVDLKEFDYFEQTWLHWVRDDNGTELLLELRECMQSLSERVQRALHLRFDDDLSRGEIGKKLGMTEHGAKNLIQRAKKRLRECLERKLKHDV